MSEGYSTRDLAKIHFSIETRADGSTGMVGDAVLALDANGYIIKSTVVTNSDGSKTTTFGGYDEEGTLAFQNRITVSTDAQSTTTQFDDDGNGIYDRSQTDVTTIASGMRQRAVSNFDTDGSEKNCTPSRPLPMGATSLGLMPR
ncbi:hypothetical protein NKI51_28930 [Mesorhizobium australicum]|uniref:hypothetical protein n=1 Tax=Mesorhizobium australicum TaxID=536018 RepID=UPI0033359555